MYSSEVGNNDFCAFPFLSNQLLDQTMHVLIVQCIKNSEKKCYKIYNSNRQVTWIILIQYRFLPAHVNNYFITIKPYVN